VIEMPADIKSGDMEKTVTAKAEVIDWLKRSLDAVKTAHAAVKPAELQRKVRSKIGMPRWMASICESLFMPTSTWGNWSRTPA
jgi:hypothetical protein